MNANAQRDNCNPESTTIFQGSMHINDSAEPIYSIKTTDEHRWTQIRQRELTRVDEHRECHYLVTRSRSGRCSFGSASVLICVQRSPFGRVGKKDGFAIVRLAYHIRSGVD
jgi:hypothetical protein